MPEMYLSSGDYICPTAAPRETNHNQKVFDSFGSEFWRYLITAEDFSFLRCFKRLGLLLATGAFLLMGLAWVWLRGGNRARFIKTMTVHFCKQIGTQLLVEGVNVDRSRPRCIVANHLSYIDSALICSLFEARFVSSKQMGSVPLLGSLMKWLGVFFIERRTIRQLPCEVKDLAEILKAGESIVFFPEGTTSNGEFLHNFRSSLFDAAILADVEVLPVCLQYLSIGHKPVTFENRDALFWYNNMALLPHLLHFLGLEELTVKLSILDPIKADKALGSRSQQRKKINKVARQQIEKTFVPLRGAYESSFSI